MKAWKNLEKHVAMCLDGSRVIREDWGKRDCDIRHSVYSIECKFRTKVGLWYNEALDKMRELDHSIVVERTASDFVLEAIDQAHGYCSSKPAMAVLKKKSMAYEDALVFMEVQNFPMSKVKHVKLLKGRLIAFTGLREFTNYWGVNKYNLVHLEDPNRYEG